MSEQYPVGPCDACASTLNEGSGAKHGDAVKSGRNCSHVAVRIVPRTFITQDVNPKITRTAAKPTAQILTAQNGRLAILFHS